MIQYYIYLVNSTNLQRIL